MLLEEGKWGWGFPLLLSVIPSLAFSVLSKIHLLCSQSQVYVFPEQSIKQWQIQMGSFITPVPMACSMAVLPKRF